MVVTSIRYQPIEGGALGGHFALHVTLGGGDAPGVAFGSTELSTRIHDVYESLALKYKAVRGALFDCRKADVTDDEMTSLLGTLKDWGLSVILWVNESTRYSWFEFANYIAVFVTSQHWPNFKVSEIRYVMPVLGEEWIEPDVYDVNASVGAYLIPRSGMSSALITFATECRRPWGVVIPMKRTAIEFKLTEKAKA
jgi:hypothetical protein